MVEKKMHVLDFFLKGLDADVQRDIHHHLKEDFTEMDERYLQDQKNNYKKVYEEGIFSSEEELAPYLEDRRIAFDGINLRMVKKKRRPLFVNTENLLESIEKRKELLSFLPESECCKLIGCESYESYVPKVFEGPEREKTLNKLLERCEPEQPQPGVYWKDA